MYRLSSLTLCRSTDNSKTSSNNKTPRHTVAAIFHRTTVAQHRVAKILFHIYLPQTVSQCRVLPVAIIVDRMIVLGVLINKVMGFMDGDLAPSLGGQKKISRDKFSNDLFRKNFPFWRRKFLMTIFGHRPYFVCLLPVSTVNLIPCNLCNISDPFFLAKILYFRTKHSFMTPIF